MDIINKNSVENPNPKSSNVILLDTAGTDFATSYPNGVYAILTYPAVSPDVNATVNADNLSSINMNTDQIEGLISASNTELSSINQNTSDIAYQDVPFTDQVSVLNSAQQITTNANKGWMTLSIDPDTTDVIYIGNSSVTTSNGYLLKASNPSWTVSTDNLSEWYVIGAAGGETLYVGGAYIS